MKIVNGIIYTDENANKKVESCGYFKNGECMYYCCPCIEVAKHLLCGYYRQPIKMLDKRDCIYWNSRNICTKKNLKCNDCGKYKTNNRYRRAII